MSTTSVACEDAARAYAEAHSGTVEAAFLAGVQWEQKRFKPRGHPCRVCGERTIGNYYCDEHRYDPCVKCERPMRRNGQKAADHPGTVGRNTLDTCSSCYARARRVGEYTGDLQPDPEHLRIVSDLVNARFAGNDLFLIASALGVQDVDTQVHV